MSNQRKLVLALTLQFAALINGYAQSRFEEEFDDTTKQWQEIATQLPAIPNAEDLIPFYVSASTTLSFAVDSKSLKVDSDGVIRYVLVTQSQSGAQTISYEGIRCASSEVKLYAFGHKDGTWGRSRRDKWLPIVDTTTNRQHAALNKDYFCNNRIVAGSAEEILRRMRSQRALTRELNSN